MRTSNKVQALAREVPLLGGGRLDVDLGYVLSVVREHRHAYACANVVHLDVIRILDVDQHLTAGHQWNISRCEVEYVTVNSHTVDETAVARDVHVSVDARTRRHPVNEHVCPLRRDASHVELVNENVPAT